MKLHTLYILLYILMSSCATNSDQNEEQTQIVDSILIPKIPTKKIYTSIEELELLQGIWIAEDYLASFDQSLSSIKSKNAFDSSEPVGLRINLKELSNGKLNIGFSGLHDHLLRPEVSTFIIKNGETIQSDGYFNISINENDTIKKFKTSSIYHFSDSANSYLTWTLSGDTAIYLERESTKKRPYQKIKYKRISNEFKIENPYPNPIYFYTRNRALTGEYTLIDSLDNVLSRSLKIGNNGKITGYSNWNDKTIFYSTDIYCGAPELSLDAIFICDYDTTYFPKCSALLYNRVDINTIQFHKSKWTTDKRNQYKQEFGKMKFKLIKNNYAQQNLRKHGE